MIMLRMVSNVHDTDILVIVTLLQIYLLSLERHGSRKASSLELGVSNSKPDLSIIP